jgi:polysaccharide biosynthesis transport protein
MYESVNNGVSGENAAPTRTASSSLDLSRLFAIVWKRRRWVIATTAVCLVAAVLFGQLAPHRYTALTQILIDPNELKVLDNVLRAQSTFNDAHIAQVESQARVLVSDNVLKRVIDRLKLDQDPEFIGTGSPGFDPVGAVRTLLMSQPAGRHDPALDALRELKKRTFAKRAERTYVVETGVWTREPDKAVRIADALVAAFLDEQAMARAEAARRASGSLNARLSELQERVRLAEERVEDYKKQNGILSASGQLVSEHQLSELNSQLVLARTRTAEAMTRYEQIRTFQRSKADPGAVSEAIQSSTIAALRSQLAEIQRRQGELTATLGARHPSVGEIESQVRNLNRAITDELARIAEAARNEWERAKANEQALARNLDTLKHGLEDTNEARVKLRELERELAAGRSVYESFLVRTREVSEQERLDTTNIRVIASAEPPQHRSFPPRTLILMAAALFAGLPLGAGVALLREWMPARPAAVNPVEPMAAAAPAPAPVAAAATAEPAPPIAPPAPAEPDRAKAHEKIAALARAVAGERRSAASGV